MAHIDISPPSAVRPRQSSGLVAVLAILVTVFLGSLVAAADSKPVVKVEPVDGADAQITATMDVAASPARVWEVLVACEDAPKFMPNLKACSVLEKGPVKAGGKLSSDVREHRIEWSSLMPNMRSVFRSEYDFQKTITFQKAGGDLQHLDGSWSIEAIDGGRQSRVHYVARVGFSSLIPGFMVRSSIETDFPQFLDALKSEMLLRERAAKTAGTGQPVKAATR